MTIATGRWIRRLRKKHKWTQERLAHELGVSFVSVNRWENGHAEPSRMAKRLMKFVLGERL
jgi:putative transcriptional regulator